MTKAKAGAIDRGQLKAAQSAMRAISKEGPKRGKELLKGSAIQTAKIANRRLAGTPGGNYRPELVNLNPYATQRDAGLRATRTRRAPILHAFEYGARSWHIPIFKGKGVPSKVYGVRASEMRRRVLPRHVSGIDSRSGIKQGYVVAPTIGRLAPKIDADLNLAFTKAVNRQLDSKGITRG